MIIGTLQDGQRTVLLTGQATKPAYIPYQANTSSIVISFAAGAYLPHLHGNRLLNSRVILPASDATQFHLAGHDFAYPTFDNAEALVV